MLKNVERRQSLCEFSSSVPITSLLKKIYENRDISSTADTTYSLDQLYPPGLLKDIDVATDILSTAIATKKSIMIVGDYDTDGATATTLGMLCLQEMGGSRIDYLVPNRFEYGYGLSLEIAELALSKFPDLLVTVDNGISSIEGVNFLRQNGVQVIITDHHLPGKELPDADAIVNPCQPGCQFPSKSLAGVGVLFYILLALRTRLRERGWFEQENIPIPNLANYLDLVALGTVADMVSLDRNNRILVAQGIARIRSGQCRAGIVALLEVAGKGVDRIAASDFGFVIAPRLNASGRLDDISTGIECLLTNSMSTAREYAAMLNEINIERRKIEKKMQDEAFVILNKLEQEYREKNGEALTSGICLFDSSWHQGVTGLVASRIKDKIEQPAIVFAGSDNHLLTGSARSVPGLHIRDLLEEIATRYPQLIVKFGGHAMAAGLTIHRKDFELFKESYSDFVHAHFKRNGNQGLIMFSDGELEDADLTLECAELLRDAAPWGQGFPAPTFDGTFKVLNHRIVGDQHIKFYLQSQEGSTYDAIAFRAVQPGSALSGLTEIHAVYQMDVNEFRGQHSLQLIIESFQKIDSK